MCRCRLYFFFYFYWCVWCVCVWNGWKCVMHCLHMDMDMYINNIRIRKYLRGKKLYHVHCTVYIIMHGAIQNMYIKIVKSSIYSIYTCISYIRSQSLLKITYCGDRFILWSWKVTIEKKESERVDCTFQSKCDLISDSNMIFFFGFRYVVLSIWNTLTQTHYM